MRCNNCKTDTPRRQKGLYHYAGCGLPDVYLKNVKWTVCPGCKEITVEIPRIGQLHRCIAWLIIVKNSYLTGQEMIYLRKMLRKNQRDMAEVLGIGQVSLNRWEREKRKGHTKAMDTLFRMVYLTLQDDEYTHDANQKIREALIKYFGNIRSEAAPLSAEIDPQICSPKDVINQALVPAISGQGGLQCVAP
jgi:putative zinc finger/helix-turn-helix YgiT family protein